MDAANTKYRIRQCSKCPGDLKYFCETCSSDLCLQCGEAIIMKNSSKDLYKVIIYQEKFNYLRKDEICLRHPNNVYTKYCELCKIPICTVCTAHKNHWQTDVGKALHEAKRKNRKIIQNIRCRALPICFARLADIDLAFKTVISDVAHVNSNILRNSEKLTGCLDNKYDLEKFFVKLEIKTNKYIARPYIYEHEYEQSSYAPIKFLLSVKKHESKAFKKYRKITLTPYKSPMTETVIEKLLTINFRDKGKRIKESEKITQDLRAQLIKVLIVHASSMILILSTLMEKISCEISEGKIKIQGSKCSVIPDSNCFNLFSNLE